MDDETHGAEQFSHRPIHRYPYAGVRGEARRVALPPVFRERRTPAADAPAQKREYYFASVVLDDKEELEAGPWDQNVRRITYRDGDIWRWHNLNDVEIVAPARWVDVRV